MIKVVKIGGNVVENEEALRAFCEDFAKLEGPKALVHGGGVMASQLQRSLGVEPMMVEGRRVTDEESLRVVTMVYAGWCNKHIVSLLQAAGCDAIGLAGCDASIIKAERRKPRTLSDGKTVVDYGYIGDVCPESVNKERLSTLIDAGLVPVFCAINHDGRGNLLNTNADTIASSVASALGAELIYCFEKNGVLLDKDTDDSVIPLITPETFSSLKDEGKVSEGMIPKIENAFAALRAGASSVTVKNASSLGQDSGTRFAL